MNKFIKINKDNLLEIALTVCAFSMSMPTIYFNIAMSLALVIKIITFKKVWFKLLLNDKLFIVYGFSLLLILVGILYTDFNNIHIGISLLTKRLPFIIIPLLFIGLNRKSRKPIMLGFISGVVIGAIICLINVSLTENVYGSLKQIYISNWYWGNIIVEPIDKHPSYFAIYSLLSFFVALELFLTNASRLLKLLLGVLMLFFVGIILTLEARIVIFIFPVALFLYLILKTKKLVLGLIVFLITVSIGTTYFIYHPARFHNIRILKLSKDSSIRLNIYGQAVSLIKNNPILGVGSGDVEEELNKKYFENGLERLEDSNTHNQFLEEWLRGGVLCLISLVIIFLIMIKNGYKEKQTLFLIFILSMFIFSMVESILNRQQGITFFVFFSSLFYFLKEEETDFSIKE